MPINFQKNNINTKISFTAKPISISTAKYLEKRLLEANTIDIFLHSSPDEDTFNASKTLYNWLKSLGKKVRICANKKETENLYNNFFERYKFKKKQTKPDLSVWVDFNGYERLTAKQLYETKKLNSQKIMILDHHNFTKTTPLNAIDKNNYIDNSAKSCCGIFVRLFDTLQVKLKQSQLKKLYCGMLSDYQKSHLIKIDSSKIIRDSSLHKDKNSEEVLNILENNLSKKNRHDVIKHLDTLSNLNFREKKFAKNLPNKIQITPNGKLAYMVIDYNDKNWAKLGMDNVKTSAILSNFRQNILNCKNENSQFSSEQKEKFKNVKGAIIFYRKNKTPNSEYKMSIHSKSGFAFKLIDYIKINLDKNLIAGGHPDRAGGKTFSNTDKNLKSFVNNFIIAAENA